MPTLPLLPDLPDVPVRRVATLSATLRGSRRRAYVLLGGVAEIGAAIPLLGADAQAVYDLAQRVTARYRAGEMIYEVRDPAVGTGVLTRRHH